ncbi:hypothetical protein F5Y18DRAFT_444496 [Xylariaceae sp. FL1019]|nr:hypothetical protein F5Y18DRAFT_444496 [Xylariaceae sp. FL1019]
MAYRHRRLRRLICFTISGCCTSITWIICGEATVEIVAILEATAISSTLHIANYHPADLYIGGLVFREQHGIYELDAILSPNLHDFLQPFTRVQKRNCKFTSAKGYFNLNRRRQSASVKSPIMIRPVFMARYGRLSGHHFPHFGAIIAMNLLQILKTGQKFSRSRPNTPLSECYNTIY